MLLSLRLRISNFFKKHKTLLIVIAIAWVIVIIINNYMKSYDPKETPSTTYKPDVPVMTQATQGDVSISSKVSEAFDLLADEYVSYCNNKEYEKVYAMLDEDCKKDMFPELIDLIKYINVAYTEKLVYTAQSYYTKGSIYVFRVRAFQDVLATGMTGEEKLGYWNDLVTIDTSKDSNKICINGYINREALNAAYEDSNMKVAVTSVMREYERETYTIRVTNRTQNVLILSDNGNLNTDIVLRLDGEDRKASRDTSFDIAISAGDTREYKITFTKYFHEKDVSREIKLNNVRIVDYYPAVYDDNGDIRKCY